MIYTSSYLSPAFMYSFTHDGGAVGNIVTGLQIPVGATLAFVTVKCVSNLTSAGAAFISIGTATTPTLILPSSAVAGFVANAVALVSIDKVMDSSLNIIMQITGAPLTGGSIIAYINYFTP